MPDIREIANALRGAQQAQDIALAAQASLTFSRTFALIGVVLGVFGVAMGVGAEDTAGP